MLSSLFSSAEAHTYVYNMCLFFTSVRCRESVEQGFPLKRIHSTQDQQDHLTHQCNNWQSATFTLSYKKVQRRDMEVFIASQNKQVPSKEEQQHISSCIPAFETHAICSSEVTALGRVWEGLTQWVSFTGQALSKNCLLKWEQAHSAHHFMGITQWESWECGSFSRNMAEHHIHWLADKSCKKHKKISIIST